MSQPAKNSTLDAFIQVAAWYFANPPATWCIARSPSNWRIIAADGTYISSHRTRCEAVANLTNGPCARVHYAILDWYLGYSHDPQLRPLTYAEREAIAQILSTGISTAPIEKF